MNGKPQSATFEQPPPPPQLAPLAPVLVGGVDLVAQLSPEARRFLETSGALTVRPAMQLRPPLGSSRIESGPPAAEKTNQTILYVSIGAAALLGLLLLYRNL